MRRRTVAARELRYFMYALLCGCVALLAAVASYAFEPYRLLLTCIWVNVGSVVCLGMWSYLQLSRHGLFASRAGSPGPARLNVELALRVLKWAVLPLLSVAAVQYPEIASWLLPLFAPFVRALR